MAMRWGCMIDVQHEYDYCYEMNWFWRELLLAVHPILATLLNLVISIHLWHKCEIVPISSCSLCMSGKSPCTAQLAHAFPRPSPTNVPLACCNGSSLDNHTMPEQQPDMGPHTVNKPQPRRVWLCRTLLIAALPWLSAAVQFDNASWSAYLECILVILRRLQMSWRG